MGGHTKGKLKLSEIFEEVTVKERVEGNHIYRLLGIHGFGGGAFVKGEKKGTEIRSKTLHRVSKGWVIYNRLFAFRGSFAIITENQDGCYVSGEFPTFKLKPEVANPHIVAKYVVHCLNSPHYRNLMASKSTGSTKQSRSRFNQPSFFALTVEIPNSPDVTQNIIGLLDSANSLHTIEQHLLESTNGLRMGLAGLLPHSS